MMIMTQAPKPADQESPGQINREVPVCLKCLTPHSPLQHYCQECGETVGQLSPYIPFVNIPFNYSIFGTMWRRTWLEQAVPVRWKVFYMFMIIRFAPIMIIGLPFVLIAKLRRKKTPGDAAE